MDYTKSITLDVYNDRGKNTAIFAKQGDTARVLKITLTANGVKITPESGTVAAFRVKKPDGHSVDYPVTIEKDGTITVPLSAQAVACPGRCDADVYLEKAGAILSNANFDLLVQRAPIGDGITSTDEFGVMVDATNKAKEAASVASAASEEANRAAESANSAAAAANDEAMHPGRIINGTWHYWDRVNGKYVDTGIDGTLSLEIVEVITGESGTPAKVENIGTNTDIKLRITIPRGDPGGVTSIKGDAEDSYRDGQVNLTPDDIGALPKDSAAAKVANPLTFTGAETGSYDGSEPKSVNIPTVPTALKNPEPLTFTGAETGSYDGSEPKSVELFGYVRSLTAADDLNDITDIGVYACTTASLPINSPFKNAFTMVVFPGTSKTDAIIQFCMRYGAEGYFSFRAMHTGTWLPWTELAGKKTSLRNLRILSHFC